MASPPWPAQAKQPVTHEALWLMPRVGAPALSPDGTWVVFSVHFYREVHAWQARWLAPVTPQKAHKWEIM